MQSQIFSAAVPDTRRTRGSRKRRAPADDAHDDKSAASAAGLSVSSDDDGGGAEGDDGNGEEEVDEDEDEDEDDVLPANFPTAPLRSTFDLPEYSYRAARLGGERRPQRNLRQQHLAAINAVLHRSLLDGDYARAAHAFAILLRLKVDGRRVDVRKKSLWGIGAEILLHIDGQSAARRDTSEIEVHKPLQAFGQDSFRQAKSFYERLILQFPYRKTHPRSTSELTFYVAMFGVWIFQIQQRFAGESDHHRRDEGSDSSSGSDEDSSKSFDDVASDAGGGGGGGGADGDAATNTDEKRRRASRDRSSTAQELYASQLRDAQEVADAIANLTRLPPFDRHVPLLQLQADVGEWMADLSLKSRTPKPTEAAFRTLARETRRRVDQLLAQNGARP